MKRKSSDYDEFTVIVMNDPSEVYNDLLKLADDMHELDGEINKRELASQIEEGLMQEYPDRDANEVRTTAWELADMFKDELESKQYVPEKKVTSDLKLSKRDKEVITAFLQGHQDANDNFETDGKNLVGLKNGKLLAKWGEDGKVYVRQPGELYPRVYGYIFWETPENKFGGYLTKESNVKNAQKNKSIKHMAQVSIDDLSSGFMKSKDSIGSVQKFINGDISVSTSSGDYVASGFVTGRQLQKGMTVAGVYNKFNQGIDFYRILGFTGDDEKYGEGGVKFDSVADLFKNYGVTSLKALEELQGKNEYGYHSYLVVEDIDTGESGSWLYLFKGRWSRGSGAEPLTFVKIDKVDGQHVAQKGKDNESRLLHNALGDLDGADIESLLIDNGIDFEGEDPKEVLFNAVVDGDLPLEEVLLAAESTPGWEERNKKAQKDMNISLWAIAEGWVALGNYLIKKECIIDEEERHDLEHRIKSDLEKVKRLQVGNDIGKTSLEANTKKAQKKEPEFGSTRQPSHKEIESITIKVIPDEDHDFMDQDFESDEQKKRYMESVERGDIGAVGVVVEAEVSVASKDGQGQQYKRLHTFKSGGLWGIEIDSTATDDYLIEVAHEEMADLKDILEDFGVDMTNFEEKSKTAFDTMW